MIITIIKSIKLQVTAKKEVTWKIHLKNFSFNETQVNVLFSYSAPFPEECCLKLVAYTGRPRPNPSSDRRLHCLELIKTEINRRNTQSVKQVSHSIAGSLSNDDADGNENGKKAIGLD